MVPIAEYSRDSVRDLRATTRIEYDERSQGTLQLFRTQKQLDGIFGDLEILKHIDVEFAVLAPSGCVAAEPALTRVSHKIVGGLWLPGDETGDCRIFTEKLAALASTATCPEARSQACGSTATERTRCALPASMPATPETAG